MTSPFVYADVKDLPVQTIDGKEYYTYKVRKSESVYGISKKLNIMKSEIFKYNPEAEYGIKKGQLLLFPVNSSDENVAYTYNDKGELTHLVKKHETLYRISKMYNVSIKDIVDLNPSVVHGLKEGEIIRIKSNVSSDIQNNVDFADTKESDDNKNGEIMYTLKKGDTLYHLSKVFNTSIESILQLNPGLSPTKYKEGDIIKIIANNNKLETANGDSQVLSETEKKSKTSIQENSATISQKIEISRNSERMDSSLIAFVKENGVIDLEKFQINDSVINEIVSVESLNNPVYTDSIIDVALLLPFKLNSAKISKKSLLYTEFYRGFLLAVDFVRAGTEKKINVYVYDTEGSDAKVNEIVSSGNLIGLDLIIAPDNEVQLKLISEYARKNDIDVVNPFIVSTDVYNSNKNFFQFNMPQSMYMHGVIYDEFYNKFNDRDIYFIKRQDTPEKNMMGDLKTYLTERMPEKVKEIEVSEDLKFEYLDSLIMLNSNCVFVPTSAAKDMVSKIHIALKNLKEERPDVEFSLFGYPEWITYENDYKEFFKTCDTYIYSRFYINKDGGRYFDFMTNYIKWYGRDILNAVPSFAIIGYDIGMYFLTRYANQLNFDVPFAGIQNDILFEPVDSESGNINKAIYFIHYTPEKITKETK